MFLDDPAAVYTFIKIMVTSYMESMSNGLDYIFLTWSHYQDHYNLQPASEQQRVDLFVLLSTCMRNASTAKTDPLYAGLSGCSVCAPPPLCICELCACVCVCVYMNVPQFTPLHPHSAAVPQRTLVK